MSQKSTSKLTIRHGQLVLHVSDLEALPDILKALRDEQETVQMYPSSCSNSDLVAVALDLQMHISQARRKRYKTLKDALIDCRASWSSDLNKRLRDLNTAATIARHSTPASMRSMVQEALSVLTPTSSTTGSVDSDSETHCSSTNGSDDDEIKAGDFVSVASQTQHGWKNLCPESDMSKSKLMVKNAFEYMHVDEDPNGGSSRTSRSASELSPHHDHDTNYHQQQATTPTTKSYLSAAFRTALRAPRSPLCQLFDIFDTRCETAAQAQPALISQCIQTQSPPLSAKVNQATMTEALFAQVEMQNASTQSAEVTPTKEKTNAQRVFNLEHSPGKRSRNLLAKYIQEPTRRSGTILRGDFSGGYGFIKPEVGCNMDSSCIFFHQTELRSKVWNTQTPRFGEKVTFFCSHNSKGACAKRVVLDGDCDPLPDDLKEYPYMTPYKAWLQGQGRMSN